MATHLRYHMCVVQDLSTKCHPSWQRQRLYISFVLQITVFNTSSKLCRLTRMAMAMAMATSYRSCSAASTTLFNSPSPSAASGAGCNYAARSLSLPLARLPCPRRGRGMDGTKSGPLPFASLLARATTSEDTSIEVSEGLEVLPAREETPEESSSDASQQFDIPEESSSDASQQFDDMLSNFKQKFDSIENKSTPLIYGSASLVALLVSATVVDAIDNVPLLPKVMEFIGFGYTVWFVYRYLLFKGSREELAAAIEELKQKITG